MNTDPSVSEQIWRELAWRSFEGVCGVVVLAAVILIAFL